jgi:hypothetical protein
MNILAIRQKNQSCRMKSKIALWTNPFSYQTTTRPRYDATIGAVHPSRTR